MNKIDEINRLLENDEELSKYINKIDKIDIDIPDNLEENINKNIQRYKKKYYIDIFKIAVCLILGLFLSTSNFIKNDDFKFYEYETKHEKTITQEKISEFCYFLTTPINIERNDK